MSQYQQIAFALGGEAGQRLCEKLGIPISADTLIGAIRQAREPKVSTPRVLGVDDWAKRKGHAYGTILVDLETHRPIDLLDSRTTEAVREWLQAHPGVEIVSQDRGTEYIKGVTAGAPDWLLVPLLVTWQLIVVPSTRKVAGGGANSRLIWTIYSNGGKPVVPMPPNYGGKSCATGSLALEA